MKFDVDHPFAFGRIVLPELDETFESCLALWRKADYERQWTHALDRAFRRRPTSSLVTSVDAERGGIGRLWTFNLIPALFAVGVPEVKKGESCIYVPRSFLDIVTDPALLNDPVVFYEELSDENHMPYTYFYPRNPTRIYKHINACIMEISYWKVHTAGEGGLTG